VLIDRILIDQVLIDLITIDRAVQSILTICRPWIGPWLPALATRSGTGSTSSNWTNKLRSSKRNETNCSRSKTRSTCNWINSGRMTRRGSSWSSSTSNRHSNYSKNTIRSDKSYSRNSSLLTGKRATGKIGPEISDIDEARIEERGLNGNRANRIAASRPTGFPVLTTRPTDCISCCI
jgi:hypothetical protein